MSDDEGFGKDHFNQFNSMFLGLNPPAWGVGSVSDLEDARELVMAAYVIRGELGDPDELGEETWNALAAGEESLNNYNLHQGEARVEYWLGELNDGLSRDNLLGEMLYQAAQGNAGLNTDPSNIDFREQMANELAERLDQGELNADNLLEQASDAQYEIGKLVAKDYSYTVADGLAEQEAGELPKWYSINDTAANMANALDDEMGMSLLMGAQVSWPTDADTADQADLDKLKDALGDRFQEEEPGPQPEPPQPGPNVIDLSGEGEPGEPHVWEDTDEATTYRIDLAEGGHAVVRGYEVGTDQLEFVTDHVVQDDEEIRITQRKLNADERSALGWAAEDNESSTHFSYSGKEKSSMVTLVGIDEGSFGLEMSDFGADLVGREVSDGDLASVAVSGGEPDAPQVFDAADDASYRVDVTEPTTAIIEGYDPDSDQLVFDGDSLMSKDDFSLTSRELESHELDALGWSEGENSESTQFEYAGEESVTVVLAGVDEGSFGLGFDELNAHIDDANQPEHDTQTLLTGKGSLGEPELVDAGDGDEAVSFISDVAEETVVAIDNYRVDADEVIFEGAEADEIIATYRSLEDHELDALGMAGEEVSATQLEYAGEESTSILLLGVNKGSVDIDLADLGVEFA